MSERLDPVLSNRRSVKTLDHLLISVSDDRALTGCSGGFLNPAKNGRVGAALDLATREHVRVAKVMLRGHADPL
jgi:hypothetical protein